MKSNKLATPAPEAPAKQNKSLFYVLMGLLGFFIVSFLFVLYVIAHAFGNSSSNLLSASDEITLIEIQGPIFQSDDVVRRIKRFRKSDKKVLLLRLNSPGGAVAP